MSRTVPLLRWLLVIALATMSGCSSLGRASPLRPVECSMVFQPAKYPVGDWLPSDLDFEDAWLEAADGTKLHGWYVPHHAPRGVALFCHGNGGNITGLAETLRVLNTRHELAVMTFDYRGYGRSEGKPTEAGILQDARAARKWLAERTNCSEGEFIIMGQSLGGAVAIDLAANDGARALVLQSTFTSLPDVGATHAPWLLPHWNMTMRFDSLSKIKRYPGPVLISHGDADEVVPFSHGQKLFAAAQGSKQFFRERDGRHNDARSEEYRVVFEEFLLDCDRRRKQ